MRQEALQKEEVVCRFGVKDKKLLDSLRTRSGPARTGFYFRYGIINVDTFN